MIEENKTHFRKAFHSPYLGAVDLVEPIVLTIKRVVLESDKTKKTKDLFNTAYFAETEIRKGERMKPMILNATNSKTLSVLAGSKFIEDWAGVTVTLYVDPNVSFGRDRVEGLRLAGADAPVVTLDGLLQSISEAETLDDLNSISRIGQKHLRGDPAGFKEFAAAGKAKSSELKSMASKNAGQE